MKTNQEYKNAALAALKGNWTQAVLAGFAFFAVSIVLNMPSASNPEGVFASLVSLVGSICLVMPLSVGLCTAYRELYLGKNVNVIENTFKTGFANWKHNVGGMLLVSVYTFAWMLLLVVPGVIKAFAYALTPFILAERPELSANEAIELSMKMMDGHKRELFILLFSFIGWYFLSAITLCIGALWVVPYQYTAMAAFYEDVKAEYESRQTVVA